MLKLNQLVFLQLLTLSLVGSLDFSREKSGHSGLIFVKVTDAKISYDSYTMVYHIDLNYYLEIKNMIKNYLNQSDIYCSELHNSTCYVIIDSIKSQMEFLFRDEMDINAFQQNQIYSDNKRQNEQ